MSRRTRLSRRLFLASAGGMTVAVGLGAGRALWPTPGPRAGQAVNAWAALLDDGRVAFACPAQDLGQGAPLALSMILAAEIGADPGLVAVQAAPRDAGTYGNPDFDGRMVTADSKTTRGYWPLLRLAGAEMRAALIATAARMQGWAEADCSTAEHSVAHRPSGARVSFAEIAANGRLRMPGTPGLRPGVELTPLGTSPDDPRMRAIVTGQKRFGTDRRATDASVAVLARSQHLDGLPLTVDDTAARAVPGVEAVVILDDAVAVVARHTWAALKGREALVVRWSDPGGFDSETEAETLRAALDDDSQKCVTLRATGVATGAPTLTARFHAPMLKHLVPEPLNAQARGKDYGLGVTVESATQSLDLDMRFAAQTWKTAPFMVETIAHPAGGAYGRRVLNDVVRDACAVTKSLGRPVQVIRPLVDELQRGQVRPAAAQRVAAWLAPDGTLSGWSHDFASDGPLAAQLPASLKGANGDEDNTATDGAYHPYRVPADRIRWTRVATQPVPGFLRGVSAGYTVWRSRP
ncbi:Isoquinoline 1-oxidoreductase beta subunit (plasmid) [Rhodovulum sp. P5]|uniref:molybdopterin cofactor-binding domain-containing protein n=1 Tax=Rhodovulum sp. P5 TaxID=1564506 RepID=UPI0009C29F18|nr:molybdopterin cofactor-binding domain-containing protein [Rhodovulum sp. P5]ARE42389.1 Isoquinoline 1-oxidoreductase beta subunit [Rhodovulum sp. P5]